MKPDATLIVSVYNKARELELVLAGIARQSYKNFEIIISDDGSDDNIKILVEAFKSNSSITISHIWQPDEGFRKNKILNKSLQAASSDYLIFIDGDCIPHYKFVEEHLKNKAPFTVLCGSRVMLSKRFSGNLTPQDVVNGYLEKTNFLLILEAIIGKAARLEEALYIKNKMFNYIKINRDVRILGSNFSIEKSLLIEVNGFDERYEAPGLGEDSDLEYRLKILGVNFKSVRNLAILYHIYHPKTNEHFENHKIFKETKKYNNPKCLNGIEKLISPNEIHN